MEFVQGRLGYQEHFFALPRIDNLDFNVKRGELRVVIGPNGAGKSTLLDVITGKLRPTCGRVLFRNREVTRMREQAIARLGIGRKFQTPNVFKSLTVLENLMLAQKGNRGVAASMAADEGYMKAQNVAVDNDWNYVHNMMYAIANLMEAGKLEGAIAVSEKLKGARGQLEDTLYPWSPRDSMARLDARLPVALRTADWAGALAMLKPRLMVFVLSSMPTKGTKLKLMEDGEPVIEMGVPLYVLESWNVSPLWSFASGSTQ